MFSDSSDEEDLTAANMEALSAKLDTFAREDILAAQDELLNPIEPVAEGVLQSTSTNEDLSSVRTRIMEIVRVLGNFKQLQEEGVKRKDYLERLVNDIAGYYSYNTYLARKFLEMFSVAEVCPGFSRMTEFSRRSSFLRRMRFLGRSLSGLIRLKRRGEISLMPLLHGV
jgi:25S rRNA (cytosine2870-C5)-methyltransferase